MKRFTKFLTIVFILLANYIHMSAQSSVLTQEMINKSKKSFTISKAYTLNHKSIVLPKNYKLIFKDGSIDDGTIQGNGAMIEVMTQQPVFGTEIKISGSWNVANIYDSWFKIRNNDKTFVSNQIIENILKLANDRVQNHIYFSQDRTYYFELPYKNNGNFGEMISYKMVNGVKKRNYFELYDAPYSYLRIFTIPSNTHVTMNSTLQMLPTSIGAYFVFWEKDKTNIAIDGKGQVSGDLLWHIYDKPVTGRFYFGEWGDIFCFTRCKNITIKDITISDAFGDCVEFHGSFIPSDKSPRWAEGLTMKNVKILRARRNGITMAARNSMISRCHFDGCGMINGTFPKCGIDFEADKLADYPEIGNQNVVFENCTFGINARDISASNNNLASYGKIATTIKNCHFRNPIHISWGHWIRLENCTIQSFIGDWDSEINSKSAIKNTEFIQCKIVEMPDIIKTKQWNNKFVNCTFGK